MMEGVDSLDLKRDAEDLDISYKEIGSRIRRASLELSLSESSIRDSALRLMASELRRSSAAILAANGEDVSAAQAKGLKSSFIDRLFLDSDRLESLALGVEDIMALPDPLGVVESCWTRPNGLEISRIRTSLGVVGMIYESRPGVAVDASALCIKSGNGIILRGGSDSFLSSTVIIGALRRGLSLSGLSEDGIWCPSTSDRSFVGKMLSGFGGVIDVLVPRGGRSLVSRVQNEARIPVFAHLEGICHVYVDGSADLEMARLIILNSKMRRVGICGAAETLLVDRACSPADLGVLVSALLDAGCAVRGDGEVQLIDARVIAANEDDWGCEYLDKIISVRCVDGVKDAVAHIGRYGSSHTESIVAEDVSVVDYFLRHVDSSIVMHNASTQFADGGEFGMGGEIGISTGRFHARGPIGVEQLTSFKYVVRGSGQLRPL